MSRSINECEESSIISKQEVMVSILNDNLEGITAFNEMPKFKITENFKKSGERTYELYNLEADIDCIEGNGIVLFEDTEQVLDTGYTKVLKMFMVESLIDVDYSWDKSFRAVLTFADGTICIEWLR